MPAISNATPLMALDAVVIDTETTSLDPAKARIVEIAAVRLTGGRVEIDDAFVRLVRPDEAVPASAVAIHHIDDAKLASAPGFGQVWPELLAFIGNAVVIGHTLGFDLAVLKRECEREDARFSRPRTLDTRLLAQVAEPNLASFTLEGLSSWLGIEIKNRHSALGDAVATARIFCALVPKLRAGGIRTLGEAIEASRALTHVLDEQHRAGWVEAVESPGRVDAERTLRRIDSYPYRHRVRDVMRAPAEFVAAETKVSEALARLMEERISSLYVPTAKGDGANPSAARMGIITERDILRAVADQGGAALALPVEQLASEPLAVIPADAFVYRAIGRMNRLKVRHLGVVDEAGCIIGALSARDLLRLRAGEAVALGDEIDAAPDIPALGRAWAKLPAVVGSLVAEDVSAPDIAAVISDEVAALTRQAAVIAEARMRDAGHGGPMCPYAVAVLGSAGRGESLLTMDQDNALVFAQGTPGSAEDQWFAQFGAHIADILHEVGVPYCKGGVMAKNPQWRGSLATWQERIRDWIGRSNPQSLLSVDIFFDMRAVREHLAICIRRRSRPSRVRQAVGRGRWRRRTGPGISGRISNQARPDRSEKKRAVWHRDGSSRTRDSSPCGGAFDSSKAHGHQSNGHRCRKRSRRADRGSRNIPRPPARATDRGHRTGTTAFECGRREAPVRPRSRASARRPRGGRKS